MTEITIFSPKDEIEKILRHLTEGEEKNRWSRESELMVGIDDFL
jgi:hypothetical protein